MTARVNELYNHLEHCQDIVTRAAKINVWRKIFGNHAISAVNRVEPVLIESCKLGRVPGKLAKSSGIPSDRGLAC